MIWTRYFASVLIAWILLVWNTGFDEAGLCFAAALALGWPLSALLLIIEPYLDPHLEAWIEGDAARLENLWRSLSRWRARRSAGQKWQAPAPGGIGDRFPD